MQNLFLCMARQSFNNIPTFILASTHLQPDSPQMACSASGIALLNKNLRPQSERGAHDPSDLRRRLERGFT